MNHYFLSYRVHSQTDRHTDRHTDGDEYSIVAVDKPQTAVSATKSHILDLIKDHCVENNIIDEVEEKPIAETAETVRLTLDFEHEERRLAREEAQRAREAKKA